MTRLKGFFLDSYNDGPLEVRKKASILIIINFLFIILSVILTAVMAMTGALVVALMTIILLTFCGLCLLLIKRGHFKVAVNMFLGVFFIILFAAIKFDAYINVYETYVISALGMFFLTITCLVGYSVYQPIAATVLNSAAVAVIYFIDVLPSQNGVVGLLDIQNIVTCYVIVLGSGFAGTMMLNLLKQLVKDAEDSRISIENHYSIFDRNVKETLPVFNDIGKKLRASSASSINAIGNLSLDLKRIESSINDLGSTIAEASASNHESLKSVDFLRGTFDQYHATVETTSSSVEQLIANINSISSNTTSQIAAVDELVSSSRSGEEEMDASIESINLIDRSSSDMLEMAQIIMSIAERTNILSMNAAIEAAHAGESGKGFAVVADEIRKLAEETGKNSKNISDRLSENIEAIKETAVMSNRAGDAFRRISDGIRKVSYIFHEVIAGVDEMSNGTDDILSEIAGVVEKSGRAGEAMDELMNINRMNSSKFEGVVKQSESVIRTIEEINVLFRDVEKETAVVDSIGAGNIEQLEIFSEKITRMKS